MEWHKLLCKDRLGEDPEIAKSPEPRTAYEADVDRIIFSSGFRRLSKKTQVHPFSRNDHIHTRLTHSLEVAQVGRTLGKAVADRLAGKLPTEVTPSDIGTIVHAACLAHDIGNPPFGHAGEEAISHWFASHAEPILAGLKGPTRRDLIRFEGNAQGFRMITQTENHLFNGGLRLTYATLGAFCKYPWSSRSVVDDAKFGAFLTEEPILDLVGQNTGLVTRGKHKWCRHPLAYLSEAADDICYATIDLEDAVELGVLQPRRAYDLLLASLKDESRNTVKARMVDDKSFRVNFTRIRGAVFETLINSSVEAFEASYDSIMNGTFDGDLLSSLPESDPSRTLIKEAKKVGRESIYTERFKTEVELGCFGVFECLLDAFCRAAIECYHHLQSPVDESNLSWKSSLVLRQLGNHAPSLENKPGKDWSKHMCVRRVLDYVSGMTDNYARDLAEHLQGLTRMR